jgi:predicted DNA-binding antitoxin AbrB/MazE fold protein
MPGDRSIEAIFEDGVFKPLDAVRLPEHQRVCLVVEKVDDLAAALLASAAEIGQSFAFLEDPREDLYSLDDGEHSTSC